MRRIVTLLSAAVLAAFCVRAQSDFAVSVPARSVKVAPERATRSVARWEQGMAVPQGTLVQRDRQVFMAEKDIASSATEPLADETGFRRLDGNGPRESLVLCNTGTATIWLNVGGPARQGKGVRLPEGWIVTLTNIQEPVFALAEGGSGTLSGVDVPRSR